jgi:hypothetical protein
LELIDKDKHTSLLRLRITVVKRFIVHTLVSIFFKHHTKYEQKCSLPGCHSNNKQA